MLTLPDWFGDGGYKVEGIPSWLQPFGYGSVGEEDDFTSKRESGLSFIRYIPTPTKGHDHFLDRHDPYPNRHSAPHVGLPFFLDSMARDPRPVIVHEGIPGHWTQFRYSWRNPREARRHWLDSMPNEGIPYPEPNPNKKPHSESNVGLAYYFEEVILEEAI